MRTYPSHSLATLQQRQLLYFVLGLAGGAWIVPEVAQRLAPHSCPPHFALAFPAFCQWVAL